MVPFHPFSRDLAKTAADQHISQIRCLEVAYFHNVPSDHLFLDPHLTRPVPREKLLRGLQDSTYLAIVSDAGAARGLLRLERVRASLDFLALARCYTRHVVWLNPMPEPRWVGTSAQLIARLVPMFQLDGIGFNQAIASLRGLARPSH